MRNMANKNQEVVNTIKLFNSTLQQIAREYNFYIIDVYKFTARNDGFSNDLFHLDNRHLSYSAIPEIERLLNAENKVFR